MEQPDQNVARVGSLPSQQAASVSKAKDITKTSGVQLGANSDSVQFERSRLVSQDQALKALGSVKLSISIDETKDLPVIKVFDSDSGKELLQVPAEHSLNISRTIKAAVGAIFDKKA